MLQKPLETLVPEYPETYVEMPNMTYKQTLETNLRLTVPLGTGGNWKTGSAPFCWLASEKQNVGRVHFS